MGETGRELHPDPAEGHKRLRAKALHLGFLRLGVAEAGPAESWGTYRDWIAEGRHGTMDWLEIGSRDRADIRSFLPGARSVVVVSALHPSEDPPSDPTAGPTGIVARYARSKDYHKGLRRSLVELARFSDRSFRGSRSRIFLDTTPVLEREWAARAGLGWIGKNGCLIDPEHGSWLLLGGFATSARLEPTRTTVADGCGECRRCLDACPTNAFLRPGLLDATRCLSYMTIEHRGPLGRDRILSIGDRIFGCDICQESCPWNDRPASGAFHPALAERAGMARWPLADLARLGREAFDTAFAGTPVRRPGFPGFSRSVASALARFGRAEDIPLLRSLSAAAPSDAGLGEAVDLACGEIGRRCRTEVSPGSR